MRPEFIEWTLSLDKQLKYFKQQLLQPRIVWLPHRQRDFILETDGSFIALGGVLTQKFEETDLEHPFALFSRALTKFERN